MPDLIIAETESIHLNNSAAELSQYVTDADSSQSAIQFSVINASSIDSRFGITIGMDGAGFIARTDNSLHVHPAAGFSGSTQIQIQARDAEGNTSNVVTLSFSITAAGNVQAAPVLSSMPNLTIAESEAIHQNNSATELSQYVTDADSSLSTIQFSIVNASSIDSRFGITIGMNGTGFIDRSDNSIHVHPVAGFSGSTQIQIQARDAEGNTSNVVTLSFKITAAEIDQVASSAAGGGLIDPWMLLLMLGIYLNSNLSRKLQHK